MSKLLPVLLSPRAVKFYSVALASVIGAACDQGLLPEAVRAFLTEHMFSVAFGALVTGLVLPEQIAGKKS